jgi:import receptor subunit TOM20
MKKLDEKTKIECTNCDQIAFCSKPCESKASEQYHVFMCSNNKLSNEDTKASTFLQSSRESNAVYPQMIAQLLSSMVAEEQEKTRLGKAKAEPYSAWDHIEKFKTKSLQQSETLTNEATKIKDLLETKVPGIGDFLKDEIYLQLKGKLEENAYQVATTEQDIFIEVNYLYMIFFFFLSNEVFLFCFVGIRRACSRIKNR